MDKQENNTFSETLDNTLPEGAEYDVFSENSAKKISKAENMNRDYLQHIYNEDMNFLSKEVQMTRTQYLRDIDEINAYYKAEKKRFYKYFVLITAVLFVGLAIGIWALREWYLCWKLYQAATAGFYLDGLEINKYELRGIWAMTGLYGSLGWITLVLSLAQFGFFGYGFYKKLKKLERYKNRSLDSLEYRKKEAMLLGQYDSVK